MRLLTQSALVCVLIGNLCAATHEISVGSRKVPITLRENEIAKADVPIAITLERLKSMDMSIGERDIHEALWIVDAALDHKERSGHKLTQEEQLASIKGLVLVTNLPFSRADMHSAKRMALDSAKDSVHVEKAARGNEDKFGTVGGPILGSREAVRKSTEDAMASVMVVAEDHRSFTMAASSKLFSSVVSQVVSESRLIMLSFWFDIAEKPYYLARAKETVSTISAFTSEIDPSFGNVGNKLSRIAAPGGYFNLQLVESWVPMAGAHIPEMPPSIKSSIWLQYHQQERRGKVPLLLINFEQAPDLLLDKYIEVLKANLLTSDRPDAVGNISNVTYYDTASGWPGATFTYTHQRDVLNKCRVVVIQVAQKGFVVACVILDEQAGAEIIEGALQVIDSIDTPESPKRKQTR